MPLPTTRRFAEVVLACEPILAPVCALALLLHPNPLTWPALILGLLPTVVRLASTGRPWRRTPFDAALVLVWIGAVVGLAVTLAPAHAAIRLTGLASATILFAWGREHASTPRVVWGSALGALALVTVGSVLLLHVAAPFLRLDRVPPLTVIAAALEPLGLYQSLVADDAALQRFRLYASGVGAVAAVGLAMTFGFALGTRGLAPRFALAGVGLWFGVLLLVSDNRGSMVAAALTLGALVVWWRPRLKLLATLAVFGTLDAIALGLVQRGFNLRTVVERLDFWHKGLLLASETPFTGVGLGVESVQLVYRAAFQPAYPPFSHTHNIYVQALLEQGILGLAGFVLLVIAVVRLGAVRPDLDAGRTWATSLAALGGVVALLAAGLTEIVALTTVGGALLFGLLGLTIASHDAALAGGTPARTQPPEPARERRALSRFPRVLEGLVVCQSSIAGYRHTSCHPERSDEGAKSRDLGDCRVTTRFTHDRPLVQCGASPWREAPPPAPPHCGGEGSLAPLPTAVERGWGWGFLGFQPSTHFGHAVLETARFWSRRLRSPTAIAAGAACLLVALLVSGLARPLAALPILNAGTVALYRATLAEDLSRTDRTGAISWSIAALKLAAAVDPGSSAVQRNLSLALGASGNRVAARTRADDARVRTDRSDAHGMFGVGRAYAAAGAYEAAIAAWAEIGAGPQLLRLGRQLAQTPDWEVGVEAYIAAGRSGAPGRAAANGITSAALSHGNSTDEAVARLQPLIDGGGHLAYFAHLQVARLYRLDRQPLRAAQAVAEADTIDRDEQIALERGLQQVWAERYAVAEAPLRWAVEHPAEPPHPVPDGDDPTYWLAFTLAKLGRHAEAVATARSGLAALPDEQASLRVPYHLLLGESLLALGRADDAVAILRAGQRSAPRDPRLAASLARARAAR